MLAAEQLPLSDRLAFQFLVSSLERLISILNLSPIVKRLFDFFLFPSTPFRVCKISIEVDERKSHNAYNTLWLKLLQTWIRSIYSNLVFDQIDNAGEELPGTLFLWAVQNLIWRPFLNDHTAIHKDNMICNLPSKINLMGNNNHRTA